LRRRRQELERCAFQRGHVLDIQRDPQITTIRRITS
jgi:hypothetical protein